MPTKSKPQVIDLTFTEPIRSDGAFPTFVELSGSAEALGTRQPVRVAGTIDGHDFTATLMPSGRGPHWLPLRAAVRDLVGKDTGDAVTIHLTGRA